MPAHNQMITIIIAIVLRSIISNHILAHIIPCTVPPTPMKTPRCLCCSTPGWRAMCAEHLCGCKLMYTHMRTRLLFIFGGPFHRPIYFIVRNYFQWWLSLGSRLVSRVVSMFRLLSNNERASINSWAVRHGGEVARCT